ncbi:WXG100 family type VII secretion target [Phycicoccus duodecadis]|uniref:PPE family protein n=1 Tax=Phycicoccus duodecadis TaxID=173053 RepID=A0A2N3YMG0_9MICO|nr:WXG100 family type VII secretion target [Phycicoccus duodecadis]PKW28051.1 hypothetical protein ATL31_2906 [Phycicoccus duodecadis]
MVIPDEGGYTPALPDDAGPHERMLHRIYGFQTYIVSDTATDWGKTADGVRGLAAEVRGVITKLQGADPPWEGPAATAAYGTLHELAKALDSRAGEIEDIKKGLQDAATAGSTAMAAYSAQVRSISTDVDRTQYQPSGGGTFNVTGYEAAVDAKKAEREAAAQQVLATFNADMGSAAKQMPVEAPQDSVMIDPTSGGGGGTPPGGGGGSTPSGGSYTPPNGTLVGVHHPETTPPPQQQPPVVIHHPPVVDPPVSIGCPGPTDPDPRGPELDGPTTGSTVAGGPGSTGWAGTASGGGSASGPGLGGAGAMTAGGLLTGGVGMLGRALGRGGLGAAGRSGPVVAGSTGAAGRGATGSGARGAVGTGGRGAVGAGGQGAGRGGRSGGIRGAKTGGRYGVPKLGEAGRGGRGVGAGGGAGGRGKGKDEQRPEDVDSLTHEDEETWFEGGDDATPPVWR